METSEGLQGEPLLSLGKLRTKDLEREPRGMQGSPSVSLKVGRSSGGLPFSFLGS